jgi:hypothetical protein
MSPQFCVGSPEVVVFDSFFVVDFSICVQKYNNFFLFAKAKGRSFSSLQISVSGEEGK